MIKTPPIKPKGPKPIKEWSPKELLWWYRNRFGKHYVSDEDNFKIDNYQIKKFSF